jgi:tetratricopeptide (TPR) repeat protein
VLVVLIGIFLPLVRKDSAQPDRASNALSGKPGATAGDPAPEPARRLGRRSHSTAFSAEQIVAAKVVQFGRNRRELVRKIARRQNKQVPDYVEKFFDAIESGEWDKILVQWRELSRHSGQYDYSTEHWEELDPYWSAVLDAYGVAEQAHDWPAQQLLDYGYAVLDSLRPGMVYVGGTDNGRWIPELLSETSTDQQHVIVTQNALADARYLNFISDLYSDRINELTKEDSERAFQDYVADAQKRFDHDQQYPDEPKQVRPGEDIKVVDGRVQVSGQIAVMAVNERLLDALMTKNPDLSFAVQESFPLPGTYGDALPLGSLMELRARNEQNTFTAERASESLAYWQNTAAQVFTDPETTASTAALKSYSHDAVSAANLLAAHNFNAEAEKTYRLAVELWAENARSVGGLADLLSQNGRPDEARRLLEDFNRQYPNQKKELERASALWRATISMQAGKP